MTRHFRLALSLVFTTLTIVFAAQATADPPNPFTAKVVKITDGDTITVLLENREVRIRLAGIDAPDKEQAFSAKAKQALAEKIFEKNVKIQWKSRDRYGRILGDVHLEKRWINLEMVQAGMAWHYVAYSKNRELAKAEKEARDKNRGLWADSKPIPPWEFRSGRDAKPGEKSDPASVTVYVTKAGNKYHLETCSYLANSKISISLKDARARYGPCAICKPPK